jgi:hypothetical protein
MSTVPPVHRPEVEWRELLPAAEGRGWRWMHKRLASVYHPDRVERTRFPSDYCMLCEEVTKELTKRNEVSKK